MRNLIGTKQFYKKTMLIAVPIVIQNAITAFVAMLDNIMVGRLGTDAMSGVAIVNQLIFVFNIIIFGGLSGAGIFCAQFFGKNDFRGVHHTFRYKMYTAFITFFVSLAIFIILGENLIMLYLHDSGGAGDILATKNFANSYLNIMLIGLLPFSINQVYSSTLRECGHIKLPMCTGIIAVVTNMILNYIFIFGKFGIPALGSDGAAIATVISRFAECGITIAITHIRKQRYDFALGFYKSLKIKASTAKQIFIKGTPLLLNEILWASGMAIINQCYSYRGLSSVAAINITSTITNLFNIIYLAMGSVVAIFVGQLLGAGKKDEAIKTDYQLIAFSVAITIIIGIFMSFFAGLFPEIYNTEPEVKQLAKTFILISSIILPAQAFCHSGYFTLRAGGKTSPVLIVDSGYMYLIVIPLALSLARFTNLAAPLLFFIIQGMEIIKCFLIFYMLKRGSWAQNIVDNI